MRITKCDNCGERNTIIRLRVDGTTYDFCSYRCLLKFVLAEIQKEKPEDRFEFGKEY